VTRSRPLERDDLPEVALLYTSVMRTGSEDRAVDVAAYLERTVLDHPWADPELPSLVHLDDDGVTQAHPQALDPGLEMGLVLLGDVVVGVLLQIAELAGGLDPFRHRRAGRALELLDLDAQLGKARGRDRLT